MDHLSVGIEHLHMMHYKNVYHQLLFNQIPREYVQKYELLVSFFKQT